MKSPMQGFHSTGMQTHLYGDVAVTTGVGQAPGVSPFRFTHVWVKRNGAWKLETAVLSIGG